MVFIISTAQLSTTLQYIKQSFSTCRPTGPYINFLLPLSAGYIFRYLVLDTKQRSLSLSQEGMALLFQLLAEQPGVVFRYACRYACWLPLCTEQPVLHVFIALHCRHTASHNYKLDRNSLCVSECGCCVSCRRAAREGRTPTIMDLWEDDVPWGNMAITALKV